MKNIRKAPPRPHHRPLDNQRNKVKRRNKRPTQRKKEKKSSNNFHIRALNRAWNQFHDGSLSHWVTTTIIAISLTIYGAFSLLLSNAQILVNQWEKDNVVTLFFAFDVSAPQREHTLRKLDKISIISDVALITPEEARKRMKQMLGTEAGILDELDENPLPYSVEFSLEKKTFKTPEAMEKYQQSLRKLAEKITAWPEVESVSFDHQWADKITAIIRVFRYAGTTISMLLLAAVALIISNTIKLTIIARREEVEVMRFMGATNRFIKTPFIYEGILQGLLGAFLALGFISLLHAGAREAFLELGYAFGLQLNLHFLPWDKWLILPGLGMFLGLSGAMLSVSRFLKV
ncbi:permease-like cell division protein FtsX [Magnetococcales bacterium HHB-1]